MLFACVGTIKKKEKVYRIINNRFFFIFCTAGATQVGFNRVSGNLLATAHDGDLRIWDLRKGSCPIQYITAHLSR